MLLFILLAELAILFFISRRVIQMIFLLIYRIFHSRSIAISLTSTLFFPGTVIHELSHLFTAEVLGVHTGKLSLVPENLEEEEITAGSVQIAKSDPFRRYLIGFAPLIIGMVATTAISYQLVRLYPAITVISVLLFYLLFVISNSMFSSREDLRGFVGFAIAIGLMIGAGYFAGIRIGLTESAIKVINTILDALVKSTGLVLAVNGILLLTLRILLDATARLFKLSR